MGDLDSKIIQSVEEIQSGTNVTVDNTDPSKPIINSTGTGGTTDHSGLNLDDGTNPHGTTKSDVGLDNADNTSDINKPISTAQQTALDGKVSSIFAGTNVTVDNTDPQNPIVSSTGGASIPELTSDPTYNGTNRLYYNTTIENYRYWNGTIWQDVSDQTDIDFLQSQIDDLVPRNELISGNVSWSGVGFIYDVSALEYRIQGTVYTTAPTQVTLDPSDPTNDRIDVIYANTSGLVGVITGTPNAAPVKPNVDSLTQIDVTFITVSVGSTAPSINVESVYDENVEWAGTTNALVTFNSANDFYTGAVSTEVNTPLSPGEEILYTAPAAYTIVSESALNFWMKFKSNMTGSTTVVYIGFFNGGSLVANTVAIGGTTSLTYGLDASNTTDWQLATIPLSEFGTLPNTVDTIKYFVPSLPGPPPPPAINFFLDKIEIQEGTGNPPANSAWQPNSIPLGGLVTNGASLFLNGGAGYYLSLSGTGDNAFLFNDSLNKSEVLYDGSDLALKLHCRLSTNGSSGNDVGLILDYAILKNGDNTSTIVTNVPQVDYDVSAEIQDQMFDIILPTMTGVVGADVIMITVTRNSTGQGADSYPGNLEIIGLEFVKV